MIAGDDETCLRRERTGEYVVIVGITAGGRRQGLRFDKLSEARHRSQTGTGSAHRSREIPPGRRDEPRGDLRARTRTTRPHTTLVPPRVDVWIDPHAPPAHTTTLAPPFGTGTRCEG